MSEDPRYPIGKFAPPAGPDPGLLGQQLEVIAALPRHMRAAVSGLSDPQLDTPYREGGWTVRQVVHHVADSHVNAYVRVKLGLTEAEPTIKTYAEEHWAALPDSTGPIAVSLQLLEALHRRWVSLLERIGPEEFARTVRHPELGVLRVDQLIGSYDWHGRHHTAHIVGLRRRMGW